MSITHGFIAANPIQELIHRRRRQVLVHSILYYTFDTNIISDALFDEWASELAHLQRDNPVDSEAVEYMREEFRDYTGETGYHLPLKDKAAQRVARQLRKK